MILFYKLKSSLVLGGMTLNLLLSFPDDKFGPPSVAINNAPLCLSCVMSSLGTLRFIGAQFVACLQSHLLPSVFVSLIRKRKECFFRC